MSEPDLKKLMECIRVLEGNSKPLIRHWPQLYVKLDRITQQYQERRSLYGEDLMDRILIDALSP